MPSNLPLLAPWQGYYMQIEDASRLFWQQAQYLNHGRIQDLETWECLQRKLQEILHLFFPHEPLTPFETFLLSVATLLYESGWQAPGGAEAPVAERYKLSGQLIRQSYFREEGAPKLGLSCLQTEDARMLVSICAAMGQEHLSHLSSAPVQDGCQETVRPRYLVALLQLADALLVQQRRKESFFSLFHSQRPLQDEDEARLALLPYVVFALAPGRLTTITRINPIDKEFAQKIVNIVDAPIQRWWAANWRWLVGEFQVEMTLSQEPPKMDDDGFPPKTLFETCKTLLAYLATYQSPTLSLPTPEQVRAVRAEAARRLAITATEPGSGESSVTPEAIKYSAGSHLYKNVIEQEKSYEKSIDVGIVIALDEEFAELFREIKHQYQSFPDGETGREYYVFERNGAHGLYSYRCVATFVGEMGPMPSGLVTHRLTERWRPRTLIMLGIAAAMSKDACIGDVVVAKQIDSYFDNSKAVPDQDPGKFTFAYGGEVYRSDHALLNATKNFKFVHEEVFQEWQRGCLHELSQLIPQEQRTQLVMQKWLRAEAQTLSGDLASGPTVGAAQAFIDWLKKRNRKYAALEMEAAGFMAAVYEKTGPHRTLVLRAISDYGDERKQELDAIEEGAFRRYAMRNAIQLLWRYFEAGILPREKHSDS